MRTDGPRAPTTSSKADTGSTDGDLIRRSRRLSDPQERPVALSKSEYALLLAFLHAPERPLSREYLLQATRLGEDIFDRSIDVQVLRLLRKLEIDPHRA